MFGKIRGAFCVEIERGQLHQLACDNDVDGTGRCLSVGGSGPGEAHRKRRSIARESGVSLPKPEGVSDSRCPEVQILTDTLGFALVDIKRGLKDECS